MLPDLAIAIFLAACLTIFVSINLYNMKRSSVNKKGVRYKAEVEQPSGFVFILAALGTGIFFLESALYIILVFTGLYKIISNSFLQLQL